MFTIQSLIEEAQNLEKQIEAASNMLQQSAGALMYVRNKISQFQAAHDEAARLAKEQESKENGQTNEQGEGEAPQE